MQPRLVKLGVRQPRGQGRLHYYHHAMGESCDCLSMKGNMLSSISTGGDTSRFDLNLSWLQFSDTDLSVFDFVDI